MLTIIFCCRVKDNPDGIKSKFSLFRAAIVKSFLNMTQMMT